VKEKEGNGGGIQMICHQCGAQITSAQKIGRQEICAKCGQNLHCCLNCTFFAESAYHQCREDQAEFVNDKDSANFCDYFQPADEVKVSSALKEDARKRLDQLFKKKNIQ
jgi:hypothetical protein